MAGETGFAMDARTNLKNRLPSRHVTEGPARAPHRSYLDTMGLTTAQIDQPFVDVALCWNEAAPYNVSPMRPAQAVKKQPRDIIARKSPENVAAVVAASGGSTNAGLHVTAIARECSIKFDLFDVAEIFKKTPYVADLKPGGRYVAKDMLEAGGIPLLMTTLLDNGYLHGDCLTVTGRTIAENLKSVKWNPHQDVIRPADKSITVTGGVVGLKGHLAPEGAIVKVAGMSNLKSTGRARCFDREEGAFEAAIGGPIALLQDSDIVEIDAAAGTPNGKLSDAELADRKTKWVPRATNQTSGAQWNYAQQVGPAVDSAVTHQGGAHEKQCYADI
jgi:dihydroxy-acid dehydratase